MTFNWWNAEMPIELCKAALSNAPAMTWSQAALYTAHAMIWSQRSYQWIWYEIMNNLSRVKSCFLSRSWIESRNSNFKTCTHSIQLRVSQTKCSPMAALNASPKTSIQEGYQPSIFAHPGSSMSKEPGFLIKWWLRTDIYIRWVTVFVVSSRITLP